MTNHQITPSSELVQQWMDDLYNEPGQFVSSDDKSLATRAAQWGADQELEACCEWVEDYAECGNSLRFARRPKPPSLKEQALEALERQCLRSISPLVSTSDLDTIRRALEALPDD
jgi:hypothetical protein